MCRRWVGRVQVRVRRRQRLFRFGAGRDCRKHDEQQGDDSDSVSQLTAGAATGQGWRVNCCSRAGFGRIASSNVSRTNCTNARSCCKAARHISQCAICRSIAPGLRCQQSQNIIAYLCCYVLFVHHSPYQVKKLSFAKTQFLSDIEPCSSSLILCASRIRDSTVFGEISRITPISL